MGYSCTFDFFMISIDPSPLEIIDPTVVALADNRDRDCLCLLIFAFSFPGVLAWAQATGPQEL